jgi:FMN phosphatase YigB (HAD superfamily)
MTSYILHNGKYILFKPVWENPVIYALFEKVRYVIFDINGTLIGGQYRRWEWVFEKGLGLRKRVNAVSLKWYEVQTGRLSFEEAVSLTYIVENPETIRDEAFKVYMADLDIREGCIELLEALEQKYELMVCSDTSGITKVIAKVFGLERYFSRFFYSIDIGWLKSDREFWETFFSNFNKAKPDEFVMVGDNPRCDIFWPNIFGMGTIQIDTTELLSHQSLEVLSEYDRPSLYVRNLGQIKVQLM